MTKRAGKSRQKRPARKPARPRPPVVVFDQGILADLRDLLPAVEVNGLLLRAVEALPATIRELHLAWGDQDMIETRRHAHKLAGLAGNFGCSAMMDSARRVETACASEQTRPLRRLLREIDSLLSPTLEALRQQCGEA